MSLITGLSTAVNDIIRLLIRIIFTIKNSVFNFRISKGFLILCLFSVLAWNSISINAVLDTSVNSLNSCDLLMIDSGAGVCVCVHSTTLKKYHSKKCHTHNDRNCQLQRGRPSLFTVNGVSSTNSTTHSHSQSLTGYVMCNIHYCLLDH